MKQIKGIKFSVVLLILFHGKLRCAPALPSSQDVIVRSENNPWNGKEYSYSYITQLGMSRKEKGQLKISPNGTNYMDVEGQYVIPDEKGFLKIIFYRANNRGFDIYKSQKTPFIEDTLLKGDINNIFQNTIKDDGLLSKFGSDVDDRIHFPTEEPLFTNQLENATLPSVDNETEGLDNRVGVPSPVVASLLGG